MAQEFTINSSAIESKINQLLPSQGGFGAGVDFSASTMVIPIVDLTETAEGSDVRVDLQTALSHKTVTTHSIANTTTTIINTTGYFRIKGILNMVGGGSGANRTFDWIISDGSTDKIILGYKAFSTATVVKDTIPYDFIVKLEAGDSVKGTSSSLELQSIGSSRQIADISGNLIDP